MNNVGKFIKEKRIAKGLTQKELGEKLFVTHTAVSKWERGLSMPDVNLLKKLAEVLEVSVQDILNGKETKDSNISDEAIKEALKQIEEKQKQKNKKLKKIIRNISVVIFPSLLIILSSIFYYNYYHPKTIKEGDNHIKIDKYKVEKEGLDPLKEIINKTEDKKDKINISKFELILNSKGNLISFTLNLNCFDQDENYVGMAYYHYQDKNIEYSFLEGNNNDVVTTYNENSEIDYLSAKIKTIPIENQIKLSSLTNYKLTYIPNKIIKKDTPIFDGRKNENFIPLTAEEYQNKNGGVSDGNTSVVITLQDDTTSYDYVFNPISEDTPNTQGYYMETDYYISSSLKFTRDYGQTWIDTDLTREELDETLKNNIKLQDNSWFISKDTTLPIAYFYGQSKDLKISHDDKTWENITLPDFEGNISTRIIGFTSPNFGYAALGTDYSMGYGENKKAYFTKDGGETWQAKDLPFTNTSKTLMDMYFYDENNGILILSNNEDINFPYIYATNNGGETFEEVKFTYNNLPDEVTYISYIDNITKENDLYKITLSQSDSTLKIIFETHNLTDSWRFIKTERQNIHTVG